MTYKCDKCSREFGTEMGVNVHRSKAHEQPWKDKESFIELHHKQGMSYPEMADEWDCSKETVYYWSRKHDVSSRFIPPSHKFFRQSDNVGAEYERVVNYHNGETNRVFVHRLIAVAKGELSPSDFCNSEIVVHHESRHGLDNRHDNLEVMSQSDHVKLHHTED